VVVNLIAKERIDLGMLFSNFGLIASGFVSAVVASGVIATAVFGRCSAGD
jgi:hypothetical protein